MKKKKIIVQGDDLAYKPEADAGIKAAYEGGILTSTTVLANFISKKDKARYRGFIRSMVNRSGLDKPPLGIGVHLNVTTGKPMSKWPQSEFTRPFKGSGEDREWQGSAWRKYFGQFSMKIAEEEYRRQIEWAFEVFGKIDHIDSHQFTNAYEPFKSAFIKLAKEYKLPVRPWLSISERPMYGGDFIYRKRIVTEMRKLGLLTADDYVIKWFYKQKDAKKSFLNTVENVTGGITEVMLHPTKQIGHNKGWGSVDLNLLTSKDVIRYFGKNVELLSYSVIK